MNRTIASFLAATAATLALLAPTTALAADNGPCGNFDFSGNASCKVEVQASCNAKCDPPSVVVSCGGKCTADSTTTCTDSCGETCIKQCNPKLLDCFKGCHEECDQPTIELCKSKHPGEDCVTQGKAQCDGHCKNNCKVPDTSCSEHCTKCCRGSCQTQVNFDCDFKCMADVKINCKAQCSKPTGGIFCNGQFVNATDVQQCISYLATKLNIKVDASASASGNCTGGNCTGAADGKLSAQGCAAAPIELGDGNGTLGALGLVGAAVAVGVVRRRRRR